MCIDFYSEEPDISKFVFYLINTVSFSLTLSTPGKKINRRHFEIFFLFVPENRLCQFMHIVL